jgi:hypothetical protein
MPEITHKEVSHEFFGTQGFQVYGNHKGSFTTYEDVE